MDKMIVDGLWGQPVDSVELSRQGIVTSEFIKKMAKAQRSQRGFLKEAGITENEASILNIIDINPAITSVELAQLLGCTKGAIAHVIKALYENGFITKERANKCFLLRTTEKGAVVTHTFREENRKERIQWQKFFDENGITAEDLNAYYNVISIMVKYIQ